MIHEQNLPMHIWVEVARTTIYVHNILSHSALGFKNLEEMFTGKKPEVSHLKIFGGPSVCPHSKRKENQVRPFWKERNICWIL